MDWMSKVLSGTKDLLKCKDHVLVGMMAGVRPERLHLRPGCSEKKAAV